jgi:hypothetical protein
VTNPTMMKAMCATCLLACVVQVWSSDAVVVTSTSARRHGSDSVDRVKTANVRVERGSEDLTCRPVEDGGDTCRATGDVYGVRYSRVGLVVYASKQLVAGLRVWASKPGRRF